MTSRLLLTLSLLFAFLTPSHAEQSTIGGYSTAPLEQVLFDEAQVTAEAMALNEWLKANIQALSSDQMKGPREHLYYLIDSRVKQIYFQEKRLLPDKHDPILEILFSWAEPLGVFGGAHSFNAVKAPSSFAQAPRMKMPAAISLELAKEQFTVRSTAGWSASFPYYFMVWNVADFTAKDGPRTQLVALSTGASKDTSAAGKSQATLVFLFSPEKSEVFENYWRAQFGLDAAVAAKALGVRGLNSQHTFDASKKLHTEFTSWVEPTGTFAVVYVGMEGSYEWNRPHFIDFIRSVASATKGR